MKTSILALILSGAAVALGAAVTEVLAPIEHVRAEHRDNLAMRSLYRLDKRQCYCDCVGTTPAQCCYVYIAGEPPSGYESCVEVAAGMGCCPGDT